MVSKANFERGVVPVSDHSWVKNTRTLLEILATPCTWNELTKRMKGHRSPAFIRQGLAWLEHNGEAKTFYKDDVCYWVRVGYFFTGDSEKPQPEEAGPSEETLRNPVVPKAPRLPTIPCLEPPDDSPKESLSAEA